MRGWDRAPRGRGGVLGWADGLTPDWEAFLLTGLGAAWSPPPITGGAEISCKLHHTGAGALGRGCREAPAGGVLQAPAPPSAPLPSHSLRPPGLAPHAAPTRRARRVEARGCALGVNPPSLRAAN